MEDFILLRDQNHHWEGSRIDNPDRQERRRIKDRFVDQIEAGAGDYTGVLIARFLHWGEAEGLIRKLNTLTDDVQITPYADLTPADQERAREAPGTAYLASVTGPNRSAQ